MSLRDWNAKKEVVRVVLGFNRNESDVQEIFESTKKLFPSFRQLPSLDNFSIHWNTRWRIGDSR